MTTQSITASEARAQVLLDNAEGWSRGTAVTTTGETVAVFTFASGSRPGVVYVARQDGQGCSCPGAQRTSVGICCHMRAVRTINERPAIRPMRARYADLFKSCPCGELIDGHGSLCSRCSDEQVYQERRAAQAASRG